MCKTRSSHLLKATQLESDLTTIFQRTTVLKELSASITRRVLDEDRTGSFSALYSKAHRRMARVLAHRSILWILILTVRAQALERIEGFDLVSLAGSCASKGRVQDAEYNPGAQLFVREVKDNWRGAVPALIDVIDDERAAPYELCYWYDPRVGDVAFLLLSDLFTDASWTKSTLPELNDESYFGLAWDDDDPTTEWKVYNLEANGMSCGLPAECAFHYFALMNGRTKLKTKWQALWKKYSDLIYWDDEQCCFVLKPHEETRPE